MCRGWSEKRMRGRRGCYRFLYIRREGYGIVCAAVKHPGKLALATRRSVAQALGRPELPSMIVCPMSQCGHYPPLGKSLLSRHSIEGSLQTGHSVGATTFSCSNVSARKTKPSTMADLLLTYKRNWIADVIFPHQSLTICRQCHDISKTMIPYDGEFPFFRLSATPFASDGNNKETFICACSI